MVMKAAPFSPTPLLEKRPFTPLAELESKDDGAIELSMEEVTPTGKSKRKLSLLRKSVSLKNLGGYDKFSKSTTNLDPPSITLHSGSRAQSLDDTCHKIMKKRDKHSKSNPKLLHVVKVKGGHVELHSSGSVATDMKDLGIPDGTAAKDAPKKPRRSSSRATGLRRTNSQGRRESSQGRRESRRESSVRRGSGGNNKTSGSGGMSGSSKTRKSVRGGSKGRRSKEDRKNDSSSKQMDSSRKMDSSRQMNESSTARMTDSSSKLDASTISSRHMDTSNASTVTSVRRSNTTTDVPPTPPLLSPKRRSKSQDAKANTSAKNKLEESQNSLDSKLGNKRRARSSSRAGVRASKTMGNNSSSNNNNIGNEVKSGSDHSQNRSRRRVRSSSRARQGSITANKQSDGAGSDDSKNSDSMSDKDRRASMSASMKESLRRARSIKNLGASMRSISSGSSSHSSMHHSFNEKYAGINSNNRRPSRVALARAASQIAQNKAQARNEAKKTQQGGQTAQQSNNESTKNKKTQGQAVQQSSNESAKKKTQTTQQSNTESPKKTSNESPKKTDPSKNKLVQTQQHDQGMDNSNSSNKENSTKRPVGGHPPRPALRKARSQSSLSISTSSSRSETTLSIDGTYPSVCSSLFTIPTVSVPGQQQGPPSTRRAPRGNRPSMKKSMSQSALIANPTASNKFALDTLLEINPKANGSASDHDEDTSIVSQMTTYSAIERAVQDAVHDAISDALSQHTRNISSAAANNLIERLQQGLVTS